MGSVVFTSTYSGSGFKSATFNLRVTFSETWNASTRQTAIKATAVEIQKVSNTTNFGSMTLRGYIRVNGSNLVSFGAGSASVTISISGGSYCSVRGFSSSTIYVNHDVTGAASATFATVAYGSLKIGAFYNSSYQLGVTAQSKSVTLTKRDPITYSVTYDGNGATSGSTDAQTKSYNVALTLRQNGFIKSGYNFVEWNTAADGSGTHYAEGDTYSANAALALYAIWDMAGSVHIDNELSFSLYSIYIDNGENFEQYVPYIDDGINWSVYS